MRFYQKPSVEDQMNRLPLELREKYRESQLDRIKIDGEEIYGYFEYSFLEEKSYKEQPTRADDGSIADINNISTFLTPRIIIKYNMMGIEDYRKLMKKIKSKNSFEVECYDIVEDKRVVHNMYFAPPAMPIIYQQYLIALGVREYTIELIGTNNKLFYSVNYQYNFPKDISDYWGGEQEEFTEISSAQRGIIGNITIGYDKLADIVLAEYGYVLKGWNTQQDESGFMYEDNKPYYVSSDLVLWAIWEKR